jgi:hypothetical protein
MREIVVKFVILALVVFLLIVEVLKIDIAIWEIVVKLVAIVLLVGIIVVEIRKLRPKLCDAFIYRAKETGSIVYCNNDVGDETRDFKKLGEGRVPCDQVVECYFVK